MANNSKLLGRFKKAAKKVKLILSSLRDARNWKLFSIVLRKDSSLTNLRLRRRSFNDRIGLQYAAEYLERDTESAVNVIHRATSLPPDLTLDINDRADIYIRRFRERILMERQISLKLRYMDEDT